MNKYYVVTRERAYIDKPYLNGRLDPAKNYTNSIVHSASFGPYNTLNEAKKVYEKILMYVDDSDYGIFYVDDNKQWFRFPVNPDYISLDKKVFL